MFAALKGTSIDKAPAYMLQSISSRPRRHMNETLKDLEQLKENLQKISYYSTEILEYVPRQPIQLSDILDKLDEAANVLEFKKDE